MNFNKHSALEGKHAYLSASKYHWINYDSDKLATSYSNFLATKKGSELHELAASLIKHGIKQRASKKTFNMYVNDAIGYKMTPEQVLYYSENCFGTADAISFRKDKDHPNGLLRIHDLKTGVTPAHMEQLMIYAALFCLEYGKEYRFRPGDIDIELRIYQSDEILYHNATEDDILPIMEKIVEFDKLLNRIKAEEV